MHRSIRLSVIGLAAVAVVARLCGPAFSAEGVDRLKFAVVAGSASNLKVEAEKDSVLRVRTASVPGSGSVLLVASAEGEKPWDLSRFAEVRLTVRNLADQPAPCAAALESAGQPALKTAQGKVLIPAKATGELTVRIARRMTPEVRKRLFGMRGYPGDWSELEGIDPAAVSGIRFSFGQTSNARDVEITAVHAVGSAEPVVDLDKLFPMVDEFGQYRHRDWPGKLKLADDFQRERKREAADLNAHPGPKDFNQYGGWATGPKLDATGYFRAAKHEGKWWLVDPAGRLFWSHGVDCVRPISATPITDREHYFEKLPPRDGPLASCYGNANWAPRGYYHQLKSYATFDFYAANLLRKYGDDYRTHHAELAHQRLRAWGLNTIANWSDSSIYELRKTPYTATARSGGRRIEASEGYWLRFPDPFDPGFAEAVAKSVRETLPKADPWCVGVFVDNELSWGDETSLAVATLKSPADQPAKAAMIEHLKEKYETIVRLNAAWGTRHESWDTLMQAKQSPDAKKAGDDLRELYTLLAERYFAVCRAEVKKAAPQQLYLGCRFAWANPRAIRAAANHCDVLSFNLYQRSVAQFRLPQGVDLPLVIGEFHFGALDRGMLHPGLVPVANQAERAAAYRDYVDGALRHPAIVGTHWFQYVDQPLTGRGDGENYQIGLVDICDSPYPETIAVVREIGERFYPSRGNSAAREAKAP